MNENVAKVFSFFFLLLGFRVLVDTKAFLFPFSFLFFFFVVIFLPPHKKESLEREKKKRKEETSSNTMNPEEESFDGPEEEKDADDEKKTVFFSRAKDLRAMFEDSLSACFEPASVAVRFDVIFFVLDSRRRCFKKIQIFVRFPPFGVR